MISRRSWTTLTGRVYPPEGGMSNRGHRSVMCVDIDTCMYKDVGIRESGPGHQDDYH